MTTEEAKEIFLNRGYVDGIYDSDKWRDACVVISKWLEQETCEDAISKQAVLNILKNHWLSGTIAYRFIDEIGLNINSLPSVIPQPKIGHWITQWNVVHQKEYYYCSECREEFSYDGETGIKMNDYDYCPNCGVRMKGNNQ